MKVRAHVAKSKDDMVRIVRLVVGRGVAVYQRTANGQWAIHRLHTRMHVLPREYDMVTKAWDFPTSFAWAQATQKFLSLCTCT